MVAAGGGGATDYAYPADGGYAGETIGGNGNNGHYAGVVSLVPPSGGTQTTGGEVRWR